MNYFIALKIPEHVSKEIVKIQSQLPEFYGKKTEKENLHLTLKFLGEISEESVREVREKLREVKFEKYKTNLDYLGFFDNKKYGVVWSHIPKCGGLQKIIDKKMNGVGFKLENRFMGHLTIARVKDFKNKKEFLEGIKNLKVPKKEFWVEEFYFIKSKTFPEGPKYEVIEKYNLF